MPPGARRFAWQDAAPPLLVAALTALVYRPCLGLGLVSTDDPVFLNPGVLGAKGAALRSVLSAAYCNYSPLPQLSYVADFALWKGAPFGYHLSSVAFHCAAAAAFYALCLEIFSTGKPAARDRWAAAGAALLFSLHPLRVQSVAWVSERRDVVCGVFFLLSLLFWFRSHRPREPRAGRWLIFSLGSFLGALFSKSTALPLPFVLVLASIYPLGLLPASPRGWRGPAARVVWRETAPFFLLAAAFLPIAALAQASCGAVVSLARAAPEQRARQALIGLVFYLGKTLWPVRLSFYEWRWAPIRAATWIGAAATAALIAAAGRSRRLRPPLLAALAYQTLMLLPVLAATFGHEIAADRYTYLSGLAWAALVGAGWRALPPRLFRAGGAALAAALLLCAFLTRAQAAVWTSSTTLWRSALRADPLSWGARPNLAQAVYEQGRTGEAILLLEEQLRLYPDDGAVREELAKLIAETGTTPKDHARFHEQLGREFAARGDFAGAAWHFAHGLEADPSSRTLPAELAAARRSASAAR